jgi:hypothetical protein
MHKVLSRSALGLFVAIGVVVPPALSEGLSGYRNFELGADLATVVKQIGANQPEVKVIHSRPTLIQDLTWRPQSLGPSGKEESAQEVVFTFFDGALSRIQVSYDRYETEGLTADDLIEAISVNYGKAVRSVVSTAKPEDSLDKEQLLARWEDPERRFELVQFAYGPTYRLIGVLKNLEARVHAASTEAKRLDDLDAPQREAARLAVEQDAAKAKLEKTRLANKAKFRP